MSEPVPSNSLVLFLWRSLTNAECSREKIKEDGVVGNDKGRGTAGAKAAGIRKKQMPGWLEPSKPGVE